MDKYVAEHNGQKLTTTAAYKFASLSGRPANYARASLSKMANSEYAPLKLKGMNEEDKAAFEAPRIKEHAKRVKDAQKRLSEIAHLGEHQTVYEKATWHSTEEAAQKAAKKVGGVVVPVIKEGSNLNPQQFGK